MINAAGAEIRTFYGVLVMRVHRSMMRNTV